MIWNWLNSKKKNIVIKIFLKCKDDSPSSRNISSLEDMEEKSEIQLQPCADLPSTFVDTPDSLSFMLFLASVMEDDFVFKFVLLGCFFFTHWTSQLADQKLQVIKRLDTWKC